MDAKGIIQGLAEVREAKDDLQERAEMGIAFVSVNGELYEIDSISQMVQRDQVTVVCPIIVAGRKL